MKLYKDTWTPQEKNAWTWNRYGLTKYGDTFVVINKYAKAADMKPLGARWCPELGWHFDEKQQGTFLMTTDELGDFDDEGVWSFKPDIEARIDRIRQTFVKPSNSEYIGEIGEKIKVDAVFEKCSSFETSYSYYSSTTMYVYTFKANDKDTVVWITSTDIDFEEGKEYTLYGTVKDHKVFRNDKQTILTRCKIL